MELINKEILPLKVIALDNDGYAVGKILESNHPLKEIEISFNKNNISFSIGDHLLVELESKNKKYKIVKVIKKLKLIENIFLQKLG